MVASTSSRCSGAGRSLKRGSPAPSVAGWTMSRVLIDQPESGQPLVEGGAAISDQIVAWRALQMCDLLAEVAAGDARLGPLGMLESPREALGISFIGRA